MTTQTVTKTAGGAALHRLVRLLSYHHEWSLGPHTLRHISGIEVWHCNGLFFIEIYRPTQVNFTLLEKLRLWWPVTRCKRAANSDRLERLGRLLDEA